MTTKRFVVFSIVAAVLITVGIPLAAYFIKRLGSPPSPQLNSPQTPSNARESFDPSIPGVVVTGEGALLTAPPEGTPQRPIRGLEGCGGLVFEGFKPIECGIALSFESNLFWTVMSKTSQPRDLMAAVFSPPVVPSSLARALLVADGEGGKFSSIVVEVLDLSGDGNEEMVFGFRGLGSKTLLDLEVVSFTGVVELHRTLPKGAAVVAPGVLEAWSAQYAAGADLCCPSSFTHETIRFVGGAWRIVSTVNVLTPPTGNF